MTPTVSRVPTWSQVAIGRLRDSLACPICGADVVAQRCVRCGADYEEIGAELWDASQAAARALEARQAVLDRVPIRAIEPAVIARTPVVSLPIGPSTAPVRTSATVQSVLAVAGAGLVAVAAIVFTFFNPDVTDALVRGLIVAAITLVFVIGARTLARRGLRFSAEAVGALALVFLGLDVHALAALVPQNPWAVAAVATTLAGGAMIVAGVRIGIRVWVWASLMALAVVPTMAGIAAGAPLLGHLGTALAAFALISGVGRLRHPFHSALRTERVSLTVVQLLAIVVVLVRGGLFGEFAPGAPWWSMGAVFGGSAVLAAFSTRHPARGLWSYLAGAFGVAAFATLPPALVTGPATSVWQIALVPTAAVVGAITVSVIVPRPRRVQGGLLLSGALTVVGVIAIPLLVIAALACAVTVLRLEELTADDGGSVIAMATGLAALAAGLVVLDVWSGRPRWIATVGLWIGGMSMLTLLSVVALPVWSRVVLGCALAAMICAAVTLVPRLKRSPLVVRTPLVAAAHLLVLFAAILSWEDAALGARSGILIVVAIAALAAAVAQAARFVHVGVGYAYALAVFATTLQLAGADPVALVCLTTSAGAVAAIVATFAPAVRVRAWYAVLVVTSVPFLIGVAQVVFERSGWTALSTGLIFLLALTLVVTRRAGLGVALRIVAASVLVPALAVVVVSLGAQLLVESGSPIVLPVIAMIVALVLPAGPVVRSGLAPRIGERDAALVRVAIEASALLTAGIAVMLSLVREAAGLSTTLIVLLVLAVGGAAAAVWGERRYGWVMAGVAATGALWCAWGLAGVDTVEPYLLPPALGVALVGAVRTAQGRRGLELYAAGLLAAVVPLVVLAAVAGPAVRGLALVGAAWVLLALGVALGRGSSAVAERCRALRPVTLGAAIVAGSAGMALGVRLGLGRESMATAVPLVLVCLAVALAGALPAAGAARALRTGAPPATPWLAGSRWLYAPSLVYVAVGTWTAIRPDWFTIWTMWALMIALLVVLVAAVAVAVRRGRATGMPPVWFTFALSFATAVVAWSPRELRVEWFSLPLGVALLCAGAITMRAARPPGRHGSWALLAPGIVVGLSASVAATFTDPQTWRAILVIVLALLAILVGASQRLAAPFLIGIVVLPIENVIAFMVQIGRGIESMPWWITLAVVGAVLLIIAVTYERRSGETSGIAARLRDLA